jgi:hypothetical protein
VQEIPLFFRAVPDSDSGPQTSSMSIPLNVTTFLGITLKEFEKKLQGEHMNLEERKQQDDGGNCSVKIFIIHMHHKILLG